MVFTAKPPAAASGKIIKLLFAFILLFSFARNTLFADDLTLPRVVDNAGLLTAEEKAELEKRIASIRKEYAFDMVIVTVKNTGNKTPESFADDYFDYNGYGVGPDADGALLLRAVNTRDIHISGTGKGIYVFSPSRIEKTLDKIVPFLQRNDNYGAYRTFLDRGESYLSTYDHDMAELASAAQREQARAKSLTCLGAAAAALIIALAVFFGFRSKHKTVWLKQFAENYIKQGSIRFTVKNDTFVSTFTSRTRRAQTSGGGGGIHTGSSGRSHSGGGRKY